MNPTPRYFLDVAANGSAQDWAFTGPTTIDTYEGVARGSGDAAFIASNTVGHESLFDCGDGPYPSLGIVAAVTVHYRARVTDLTGGPVLDIRINRGASVSTAASITPTTTGWISGSARLRFDWVSGNRFLAADLADLGCGVRVSTASASGRFEVSELWLEVEHIVSPQFYDPKRGDLPDAVPSLAMQWTKTGTQSAAFVDDYLQLSDASTSDWISYGLGRAEVNERFWSIVDTRLWLNSYPTTGTKHFLDVAAYNDGVRSVRLAAFVDSGQTRIGLIGDNLNHDDPGAYLDSAPFDFSGSRDHHFRLIISRDAGPAVFGRVEVFVDYAESPLFSATYGTFPSVVGGEIRFGTGAASRDTGEVDARIDYVSWWTAKRRGETFPFWYDTEGATNRVLADLVDDSIVRLVRVPPTPVIAGQSDSCCRLLIDDITKGCGVSQYWAVEDGVATYDITLDYRMDTLLQDGLLLVNRLSDFYYWDETGGAWSPTPSFVVVPNVMTRTRTTFMTNIQTARPDRLVVSVSRGVGIAAPFNFYLYKVDLRD